MDFETYVRLSPFNKTLVNWWDLWPNFRLKLKDSFKRQLLEVAWAKAGGKFTYLSNDIGIERRTLSNYLKDGRGITLQNLRKIMHYISFPLESANDKIVRIGKLCPRFPFKLHSVEGAEIRAAFLSDGHVDKNPVKVCRYHACEHELHTRLVGLCKTVFGKFEAKTKPDGNTLKTYFPAVIGFSLSICGVPAGNKGRANPCLPKDIMLGSEAIQCAYLRRVFDDEGDVCFENKSKRAVRVTRSYFYSGNLPISKGKWIYCKGFPSGRLILGEYLLMKKILACKIGLYSEGIYKALSGQMSVKHRIQLTQRTNLEKFYHRIGFTLSFKRQKLKDAIDSYVLTKFQNGDGLKFVFERVEEICARKGAVKYSDISLELAAIGRCRDLAGRYLKKLVDLKVLLKVKRGVYVYHQDFNNRRLSRGSSFKNITSPSGYN